MVKLIIEDDEGKTTVVPLIRDEITIGRKEGNTIRLTERNVSRRHAKLVKQSSAIFIEDLNSYNGIKVNGNKIAGRVAVAEGDRIQIGDYVLGLKLEGAEASADPFAGASTVKMTTRPPDAPTAQIDTAAAKAAAEQTDAAEPSATSEAPDGKVRPEHLGQLVCLSNNFPGQEWVLDKPVMVIGRTEDNDVVVNHRSISRHHARITEENGRYTIIDLQSSNGVRINGEEYGKVELRKGDLVDLGHVRLRFVAPGEDFVFSRDASVVDISKGGRSRGGIVAAVVVVALLGLAFLLYRFLLTPDEGGGVTTDATVAGRDNDQATVSPDPSGPDPAVLVAKVSRSVAGEQWTDALKVCGQLTGEAKTSAQANCEKAEVEKKAFDLFEQANQAQMTNQWCEVVKLRNQIPTDSIYKTKDYKNLETARTNCLLGLRKELEDQIRAKSCEKASAMARQIKEVDPNDSEADLKVKDCGSTTVAAAPIQVTPKGKQHKRRVRPPTPTPVKPQPTPTPVAPTPGINTLNQAQQLLNQAQAAYVAGNHKRALQLCTEVLKLVPNHYKAIQIMGASACYLRNKVKAQWAADRVTDTYRPLLKKVCLNNGVQLK